jgi:hypothetical protein
MTDKAHARGTFPKCKAQLSYHLILGPYFENAPTLGLYLTNKSLTCALGWVKPKSGKDSQYVGAELHSYPSPQGPLFLGMPHP